LVRGETYNTNNEIVKHYYDKHYKASADWAVAAVGANPFLNGAVTSEILSECDSYVD
jgi:hypothetical protein